MKIEGIKSQVDRESWHWQKIRKAVFAAMLMVDTPASSKSVYDFMKGYCRQLEPKLKRDECAYMLEWYKQRGVLNQTFNSLWYIV